MTSRLHDKVCMINGVASKIGDAVARRFVDEGAVVVGVDRIAQKEWSGPVRARPLPARAHAAPAGSSRASSEMSNTGYCRHLSPTWRTENGRSCRDRIVCGSRDVSG
jgi:NAD(P)-dependent dehydrogenase (short-subunit alcohol dehydrogenase family)